mmetsp:Transcript_10473/g.26906  ORF Transcript_10473/g.26906 Transcript_10473/m.26906 type:complete len:213 (-) Transcript_10473:691-1329(-)
MASADRRRTRRPHVSATPPSGHAYSPPATPSNLGPCRRVSYAEILAKSWTSESVSTLKVVMGASRAPKTTGRVDPAPYVAVTTIGVRSTPLSAWTTTWIIPPAAANAASSIPYSGDLGPMGCVSVSLCPSHPGPSASSGSLWNRRDAVVVSSSETTTEASTAIAGTLCPLATRIPSARPGALASSMHTTSDSISRVIGRVKRAYSSPVMMAM